MTYYPDKSSDCMWWFTGEPLCSIGWLHPDHDYPKGGLETEVFGKVLAQLEVARHFLCHRGMHDCEFCGKDMSSGALLFPCAGRLFIAPPMIGHYMESHSYLPPEDFIKAVLNCPPQDSNEYCDLIEDLLQNRPEGVTFLEKESLSRAARKR